MKTLLAILFPVLLFGQTVDSIKRKSYKRAYYDQLTGMYQMMPQSQIKITVEAEKETDYILFPVSIKEGQTIHVDTITECGYKPSLYLTGYDLECTQYRIKYIYEQRAADSIYLESAGGWVKQMTREPREVYRKPLVRYIIY